ncbi:MAG: glycosyltransferase family 2 protein [Bacteroidales bacterium]|jgi:GT2 family glycosyltransferase|nr:glycosyltransferase family 2 protein [Bacteroidales bacterium]MDD3701610.1 glycosyltransferase family 2 protein [Bacteroidales bacterium]MDY0369801.1 glycosyltransferase family 2 protein [Bacteroidales bacterium]
MNSPTQYPLVSIITVNYNQAEVTCALLESLHHISYPNFEVIVIDNASAEDDPSIIKKRYPNIVFVQNPINYGFAAGNNFGLMRAKGEYVLLINNDIEVPPDFLEPLVSKLQNDPDIGAVSPKIKFYYQPDTIQYAGYTPMNYLTMRNFAIGYKERDTGQYNTDRETYYAHGAAMLVPMKVVLEIGLMSYIFFLYYEEADWCERIKKAGYKIFYVHNSTVLHKESVTTGKLSTLKIYYLNRNRIVFMRRNVHGSVFYKSLLYQLLVAIPKNAFTYLIKGKTRLFYTYYQAIGWHLSHLFDPEIHENPRL